MHRDSAVSSTSQSMDSGTCLASVIVVTRNRASSLAVALASLRAQSYENYEIIVVNNGSTDQTQAVIDAYGAQTVFVPSRLGIGFCRNRGVEAARGEVIAFTDDDCVPVRSWLSAFVSRFNKEPDIGCLGGHIINIGYEGAKANKGRTRYVRNGILEFVADPYDAEFYGNANLAFRRLILEVTGNYDPFFNTMAEIDLQTRLRRHGYRVEYEPGAKVEHHHRGVFLKNRYLFFGPELVRLYYCMKHTRPTSAIQWFEFLAYDLRLLRKELVRELRLIAWTIVKRRPDRLPHALIGLFNSVSARIAIPWIIGRVDSPFNCKYR